MPDDLFSKISALLDDPATSEKIKQVASSVSGNTSQGSDSSPVQETSGSQSSSILGGDKIGKILSGFNSKNNREIVLLNALAPYMRPERASKISSAIKAIQVVSLLSLLQ